MIYVSVGIPCAYAEWCEAVLTALVRRTHGDADAVMADTTEALAANIFKSRSSRIIVCSRAPDRHLVRALEESDARFLLVFDDPRHTIAFLAAERGLSLSDALRGVSASCASLMRCAKFSNALILDAARYMRDPKMAILHIAHHFGLPAAETDFAELQAAIHSPHEKTAGDTWWNKLDPGSRELIDSATGMYAACFSTGSMGAVTWRQRLFLASGTNAAITQPIDMTGRARCLVCGPYIHLPAGTWTANLVFGCSDEAAGVPLLIEVSTGTVLKQTRFQPHSGGTFSVTLKFTVEDEDLSPAEIRIHTEKAVFDGLLDISHVTMTPENPAGADRAEVSLGASSQRSR